MWASTVWGLYGLAAACVLTMLGGAPESLHPLLLSIAAILFVIATGVLCWPLRNKQMRAKAAAYCKHPIKWLMNLSGTSIVLFGLAFIIFGAAAVGIGLWRQSFPTATTPKTAQQADVPIQNPGPAKHYVLIGASPPRYTVYEKDQRLRAIDEIYTLLTSKLSPIFSEGKALLQNFQDDNQAINDSTRNRLLGHAKNVQSAFSDLAALLDKYEYYPDIVGLVKQQFNGIEEINASKNLAEEINFWNLMLKTEGVNRRDVWNRDAILVEFATANRHFGDFLNQVLPSLKAKRAEIEMAAIYSSQ